MINPILVSSRGQIQSLMLLLMLQCPCAGADEELQDFTFSVLAARMDRCIDYCPEGEMLSVAIHTHIHTHTPCKHPNNRTQQTQSSATAMQHCETHLIGFSFLVRVFVVVLCFIFFIYIKIHKMLQCYITSNRVLLWGCTWCAVYTVCLSAVWAYYAGWC